jgi:hypothetical protein
LSKVIRKDTDPTTLETQNMRQKALAVQLRKAMDMDPEKAPAMIEMLRTYLATFDNLSGHHQYGRVCATPYRQLWLLVRFLPVCLRVPLASC